MRILVLCILLLIVSIISFWGLSYSGFCFKKMRYLYPEEKLKLVFDYQNSRRDLPFKNANVEHIKYESFSKYIQLYPNCCSVNPGGPYGVPPTSLMERVLGYDSGDVVVINFNVRYSDESGRQRIEKVQFENILTNCGDVR